MTKQLVLSLVVLAWFCAISAAVAEDPHLRPHQLFTEHMVLQQGVDVPVWGWAPNGEKITVCIQDQEVKAKAKNGKWMAKLPPLGPGGPFTMTIACKHETVTFSDVLVGEVWVASGQSNMAFNMHDTTYATKYLPQATNPHIRLFREPMRATDTPEENLQSSWQCCSPQTADYFSAVAYHFARALQPALDVPVGIISVSMGATRAEAWTPKTTLQSKDIYNEIFENYETACESYPANKVKYEEEVKAFAKAREEAQAQGKPWPRHPVLPYGPEHFNRPSGLWNGMIKPCMPYAIAGVIWYQGEGNAYKAWQYRQLFPDMITSWRREWGQGDFPFLFVQLAPYQKIQDAPMESALAELREAQLYTSQTVPKTGMAVITDYGDEEDIHPRRKDIVGERLALLAQDIAYGKYVVARGPVYKDAQFGEEWAIISFTDLGGGLWSKGYPLTGFTIAGEDKVFHPAIAGIQGDQVAVMSPEVHNPVAVRFGWANHPVTNLFNTSRLPATPFRTDDYPMITKPK